MWYQIYILCHGQAHETHLCTFGAFIRKHGSSVVRHLPLVLDVSGSIPARVEENFGVRTRFL